MPQTQNLVFERNDLETLVFVGARLPNAYGTTDAIVYVEQRGKAKHVLPLPRISRAAETRHSPTGFEWGYGGSGPAELARAILMACFVSRPADGVRHPKVYQAFKADVVSKFDRDGFRLRAADVVAWLAEYAYDAENGGPSAGASAAGNAPRTDDLPSPRPSTQHDCCEPPLALCPACRGAAR